MKAMSRPSRLARFLYWLAIAAVISATLVPADVSAKTRPEVQVGDPTDTDPGPITGRNQSSEKFASSYFISHRPIDGATWYELYRLIATILAYRHP